MEQESKHPAPLAGGDGADHSHIDSLHSTSASKEGEVIHSYWLHVEPDGTECRFAARPSGLPALHVRVLVADPRGFGGIEETATILRGPNNDVVVRPRGEGWALQSIDGVSVFFRRPHSWEDCA